MNSLNLTGTEKSLAAGIKNHIKELVCEMPNRHPGSAGNKMATEYFRKTVEQCGFQTECDWFDCIDWQGGEVMLESAGESFTAFPGPYSLPCDTEAELVEISTLAELNEKEFRGKVLLVRGELAKEQLVPIGYPFYSREDHALIIEIIQEKSPSAIIAATDLNPCATAALSPFPLFEDAAFNIPSAYMSAEEGTRLSAFAGNKVRLKFESLRIPARACNVVARKGEAENGKIVVCAHIDAKKTTPGALDNAAGISVLLALAELLKDYSGGRQIELLAINGEDYYTGSGEVEYLKSNRASLKNTILAINLDAPGYIDGDTCYSFYECSQETEKEIRGILAGHEGISEGESWPMSDHMVFAMNGVPAMAFTSEKMMYLCSTVNHTEKDVPELVDAGKLAAAARAILHILQ
jgi:aminopeptidase YwaD